MLILREALLDRSRKTGCVYDLASVLMPGKLNCRELGSGLIPSPVKSIERCGTVSPGLHTRTAPSKFRRRSYRAPAAAHNYGS